MKEWTEICHSLGDLLLEVHWVTTGSCTVGLLENISGCLNGFANVRFCHITMKILIENVLKLLNKVILYTTHYQKYQKFSLSP
jgi:hypothetical protein